MDEVKLYARDGVHVDTVSVPRRDQLPEGIACGGRTYFRQADGRYVEGEIFFPLLDVKPPAALGNPRAAS